MLEAKGRNGHFIPKYVVIDKWENNWQVGIYSKRKNQSKRPPLMLRGSRKELENLLRLIADYLKCNERDDLRHSTFLI